MPFGAKKTRKVSVKKAMREVFTKEPSTVKKSATETQKRKQKQAIAFSKARKGQGY